MDLTRLPVGVIREVLRVERGDHAEHWIWNCVGAAVATGPAITAVDRDLFGSGNANPDPNLGHTMANTGEQLINVRVRQCSLDELADRSRELAHSRRRLAARGPRAGCSTRAQTRGS